MSGAITPRFDAETLREVAGDKVFARGEDDVQGGLVMLLSVEPDRVLAEVRGTEPYRTVVTGSRAPSRRSTIPKGRPRQGERGDAPSGGAAGLR